MLLFTAAAGWCDLRTNKIPNRLTVPVCIVGLLLHLVAGFWHGGGEGCVDGLLFALGGFIAGFGPICLLWLVGGAGGGDTKFMAAVGTWLGARLTLQALALSALFALAYTLGVFALRLLGADPTKLRRLVPTVADAGGKPGAPPAKGWAKFRKSFGVHFAIPVALATWSVLVLQWVGYTLPWVSPN
jgi:Flp pilus assembly protein protease CpaA